MCKWNSRPSHFIDDTGKLEYKYAIRFKQEFAGFGMLTFPSKDALHILKEKYEKLKLKKFAEISVEWSKKYPENMFSITSSEIKGNEWEISEIIFEDILKILSDLGAIFHFTFIDCLMSDKLSKLYNQIQTFNFDNESLNIYGKSRLRKMANKSVELDHIRFKTSVLSQLIAFYCSTQKCDDCQIDIFTDQDNFSIGENTGDWNYYLNNQHHYLKYKNNDYNVFSQNDSKDFYGLQFVDLLANAFNRALNKGIWERVKSIFEKIEFVSVKFIDYKSYPTFSDYESFYQKNY